jgi:hypothetical protein
MRLTINHDGVYSLPEGTTVKQMVDRLGKLEDMNEVISKYREEMPTWLALTWRDANEDS